MAFAKAEARTAAHEWLERVGLADHERLRPRALSGGQAQRVALARALATDPRLLLLDEPLAALDAGTRSGVRRDLRRHLDSFDGMRVLVTHDPVDAYALADRVAILDAGRIVQIGTIDEVTSHPRSRYVADLVGTNLIVGDVTGGVLTTDTGVDVVIADAEPGRSFAVIRPQAISLAREPVTASSARNTWPGVVGDLDRLGERVRIVVDGPLHLVAEITTAALDALADPAGRRDPRHARRPPTSTCTSSRALVASTLARLDARPDEPNPLVVRPKPWMLAIAARRWIRPRPATMIAVSRPRDQPLLGEWACLGIIYPTPTHGFAVAARLKPAGDVGRVWSLSRPLTYRCLELLADPRLHPRDRQRARRCGPEPNHPRRRRGPAGASFASGSTLPSNISATSAASSCSS